MFRKPTIVQLAMKPRLRCGHRPVNALVSLPYVDGKPLLDEQGDAELQRLVDAAPGNHPGDYNCYEIVNQCEAEEGIS